MTAGIKIDAIDDLIGAGDLQIGTRFQNGGVIPNSQQDLGKGPTTTAKVGKKRLFHGSELDCVGRLGGRDAGS